MTLIFAFWIFLGLGLVFLYAPALMLRGGNARILAACLVCIGVIQAHMLAKTLAVPCAVLAYLHELALYAVAPLLYGYVQSLLGRDFSTKQWCVHLSPLLVVVMVIAIQIFQLSLRLTLEQFVYALSFAAGAIYTLGVRRALGGLVQPKSVLVLEASLLMAFTFIGVVVASLMVVGTFLNQMMFIIAYGSAITAVLVVGHFVHFFFPQLDQVLADEIQDALITQAEPEAQRKTQLNTVDVEKVVADLERLMVTQALYKRLDLTLPLLADKLGITPHQLSELINTKMGINFPRFLKNYRLAEARRLLVEEPAQSMLDIALAVGFSSLSAFYAAFREVDGMAPGQFRKIHQKS